MHTKPKVAGSIHKHITDNKNSKNKHITDNHKHNKFITRVLIYAYIHGLCMIMSFLNIDNRFPIIFDAVVDNAVGDNLCKIDLFLLWGLKNPA